jgi:hypothetical protein
MRRTIRHNSLVFSIRLDNARIGGQTFTSIGPSALQQRTSSSNKNRKALMTW